MDLVQKPNQKQSASSESEKVTWAPPVTRHHEVSNGEDGNDGGCGWSFPWCCFFLPALLLVLGTETCWPAEGCKLWLGGEPPDKTADFVSGTFLLRLQSENKIVWSNLHSNSCFYFFFTFMFLFFWLMVNVTSPSFRALMLCVNVLQLIVVL